MMAVPPSLAWLDTRVRDTKGGFDYGRWYLQPIGSVPFGTLVPGATDIIPPTTIAGVVYPGVPIFETGILRVIVAVNPGAVFNLVITRGFPAAPLVIVQSYNAKNVAGVDVAVALAANSLYLFDVPVQASDVVNFQFGGITTINMLDAYMVLMQGP
jgi:hypothetical protein